MSTVGHKLFGPSTVLIHLKNIEDLRELLLMCDIMSIFTISEIKTKKFKYTHVKIILINPLHVVINIVLSKRLYFLSKLVRGKAFTLLQICLLSG